LHYVAKFLSELGAGVEVIPVGAVGNDDHGRRLVAVMREAGMNIQHINVLDDAHTLFGICYTFPDGSGGNLTEDNSASNRVTPAMIGELENVVKASAESCLLLAAPEVPYASRQTLLAMGRRYGAFNAASLVSEEMAKPETVDLLKSIDLLAINIDEAAMFVRESAPKGAKQIVNACVRKITSVSSDIQLLITAGDQGAYGFEKGCLEFLPSLQVNVANTAGAGDAMLAGLLIGRALGLPFAGTTAFSSLRLARLLAAFSVQSADTINFAASVETLRAFAQQHGEEFCLQPD
jgi:sugar/nucleoside kinase (ribokinase family)